MERHTAVRVGTTVGIVVVADLASGPAADVLGHKFAKFPVPTTWSHAAAAALSGGSWLHLAVLLVETHPRWFEVLQIPWAIVLLMSVHSAAWAAKQAGMPRAAATATHGSARWRRPSEMRETLTSVQCATPTSAGVVVGSDGKRAWLTRPDIGNPHVLLLGTPGTGKSRSVILPTIWTLGHAGDSMIITDPKGELYQHSAAWLQEQGYDVRLVDLVDPTRGNRWNPLAAVRAAVQAGDMAEASARAWEMSHTFAFGLHREQPGGEGAFWAEAGEALLAALALGVAAEAPDGQANPAAMLRVLLDLGGERNGVLLDGWFQMLGPDHPAALAYANTKMAAGAEKARASVYMTAATHLRLFADSGVAWLTATSDHNPVTAGEEKTAIFVCVPDESEVKHPIVSLYMAQAYAALVAAARELPGGRLKRPVWFLLDEFGNIGKLADIRNKVSAARSRGVRFLFAVQNLEQLDGVYGKDDAATIIGNCDTLVYLSTNSNATAKTISDRIGSYTVKTTSMSTKPAIGASVQGTEAATGRPLLAPDEVMRLPPGTALVLQARHHAARTTLADLSKWAGAAPVVVPSGMPPAQPAPRVVGWTPDAGAVEEWLYAKAAAKHAAALERFAQQQQPEAAEAPPPRRRIGGKP